MDWKYNDQNFSEEMIEEFVGFVYRIDCQETNKFYIGKKLFTKSKIYQKNKKKKRKRVSSNWKDYYGSSEKVQVDVDSLGKEKFTRNILRLCKSKAEMSYFEAKYQFEYDVLFSEDSYNDWISVRVRRSHFYKVR